MTEQIPRNETASVAKKKRKKAENPSSKRADATLVVVAAARWVDALNAPRDSHRLAAACVDGVVVERMGVFDKQGTLAETFEGLDAVAAWLDRLPDGIAFELAGAPEQTTINRRPAWQLPYAYRIAELQFAHGGTWSLRLADDGRVAWLRHAPEPLPAHMSAGGRDQGGQGHDHGHHHDHDHDD